MKSGTRFWRDVGAPVQDGAGHVDFNTKDGRRFSVVHGYLLPALERPNLTLLTGTRVEALRFDGNRCIGVRLQMDGAHHAVLAEQETVLCAGDPACSCSQVSAMARSCAATASPL
jgi:choline dehydrogenase